MELGECYVCTDACDTDPLVRRSRFSDNVEVSPWFWFCCKDCFNCLVCFKWCAGGSVTVA